jgi:hypothetical protein
MKWMLSFSVLFIRNTLNVQFAFQNEDDFIRNLVRLRGELRSGIALPVPAGPPKGSFAGLAPLGVCQQEVKMLTIIGKRRILNIQPDEADGL